MGGKTAKVSAAPDEKTSANPAAVDPMQWWGAIGQQFQTIASQAVADMQKHANTLAATADKATQRADRPQAAAKTKPRAAKTPTAARQPKTTPSKPRKTAR